MIQQFEKIRRDRKVVDESMTAKDMIAKGWLPEKVMELRWLHGTNHVCLSFRYGVLARVVQGRDYVALIEEVDETGQQSELWVINADGSKRLQISNTQPIRETNVAGEFGWLEPARCDAPDIFGVIFGRRADSSAVQLDIDAKNGAVVGVYPAR